MKTITPQDIKNWLMSGREFAFIDVREEGQYGEGHLLHAVTLPYSRLELSAAALIPRADVPVCVMDDGEGVAQAAAKRLETFGYTDVRVLAGGLSAAAAAGFTVFKGVNVPSKTLGELAEEAGHTPSIDAEDMKRMLDDGDDFILLDGRTPNEFNAMSIPGGRSCPNAELPYRLPELVSSPATKVVVNCAGRTRSLIGAQSLRNFGFENPIFALKNGTQGWRLAGFELDHGRAPAPLPEITGEAAQAARARAETYMRENAIPKIDIGTATEWAKDASRTFYLFDVRTEQEYAAGHLPGAVFAPGGQLVQATDKWVAVRGARIVLSDDDNIRAANTAYWLRAMGHDAHVLVDDASAAASGFEAPPPAVPPVAETLDEVSAANLAAGTLPAIIDLRASADFRDGHIEGAVWSIRPRLASLGLSAGSDVVLVAPDKGVAELAAMDLRDAGVSTLRRLAGGPDDWRAAGLDIVATPDLPPDSERLDFLFFVHDRHQGNAEASRAYLNWELGLIGQLKDWELGLFPLHGEHGH
jgi:rhodanese-related sulfurtransferase